MKTPEWSPGRSIQQIGRRRFGTHTDGVRINHLRPQAVQLALQEMLEEWRKRFVWRGGRAASTRLHFLPRRKVVAQNNLYIKDERMYQTLCIIKRTSINQPINQPTNQSINQKSINQSINQWIGQHCTSASCSSGASSSAALAGSVWRWQAMVFAFLHSKSKSAPVKPKNIRQKKANRE